MQSFRKRLHWQCPQTHHYHFPSTSSSSIQDVLVKTTVDSIYGSPPSHLLTGAHQALPTLPRILPEQLRGRAQMRSHLSHDSSVITKDSSLAVRNSHQTPPRARISAKKDISERAVKVQRKTEIPSLKTRELRGTDVWI
jgi:hypothetical protein